MGILMQSTTISVLRSTDENDEELKTAYTGNSTSSTSAAASGIPAHISGPGGSEIIASGGEQANLSFRFQCDPCDIKHTDIVLDEKTGRKYQVQWVAERNALGMHYLTGALKFNEGSEYFNG